MATPGAMRVTMGKKVETMISRDRVLSWPAPGGVLSTYKFLYIPSQGIKAAVDGF